MICFPNCKINIGLNIVGKRTDGYHNIQSVFYPVPIYDALEVSTSQKTTLNIYGDKIKGDITSNLIYKAWKLIDDLHSIGPVSISLLKKIPSGGGLGGGSGNGAFMLNLLNEKFNLNISTSTLEQYAAELGSDCPFFIQNKPSIVTGRGEFVEPINLSLKGYHLALINPKIHISTADAFKHISPVGRAEFDRNKLENTDFEYWNSYLNNDFEEPILKNNSKIQTIKKELGELGAVFKSLSGTGSSYYGIFENRPNFEDRFSNCDVWSVEL